MLTFGRIPVGAGETVACRRCAPFTAHSGAESGYHPAELILAEMTAVRATGIAAGVMFSGPEPLAHPALPTLVSSAAETGFERIGIATSAAAFAVRANTGGAIAAGVRIIEVPLLGPDGATHDALAGRAGAFAESRAGVSRFRETAEEAGARVAVRGRLDVCAHTAQSASAAVVTFVSWGASSVELRVCGRLGPADVEHVRAACETGTVNGVWVAVTGARDGLLGGEDLHATDVLEYRGVSA